MLSSSLNFMLKVCVPPIGLIGLPLFIYFSLRAGEQLEEEKAKNGKI